MEERVHDAFTFGIGDKFGAIAEQSTGGNQKMPEGEAALDFHLAQFSSAPPHFLNDAAGELLRAFNVNIFKGFQGESVHFTEDNFRPAHLKLITLAAHLFNKDGEVKLAPATNFTSGVGMSCRSHFQGYIAQRLALPTRFQPPDPGNQSPP